MRVSEALDLYTYAVLRLSPATQEWYMARLKRFSQWCDERGIVLETIKQPKTREYIEHLRNTPNQRTGKPLSTYTVHGHARAIRTFLRWCSTEEDIGDLITESATRVKMPRVDKVVIKTFEKREIDALLKAADRETDQYKWLRARDKTIVTLLLETGIRASELCDLTLDNLFLTSNSPYIRVIGKGRKEREVGISPQVSKMLHKFTRIIMHRDTAMKRKAAPGEKHVFLSSDYKPLTVGALDQMLYRLSEWSGVENVHAHRFRHTFAVYYLAAGGDLFDLARLMGHSTTEITRLYLECYSSTQARKKGISVTESMK